VREEIAQGQYDVHFCRQSESLSFAGNIENGFEAAPEGATLRATFSALSFRNRENRAH
jgi:hypothetical protein